MGWSRRKKLLFSTQGGLADQVQAWVNEGVVAAAWIADDPSVATYEGAFSGSILRNCAWRGYTGAQEIANGTFDADASWTKGTGWSIGSGKATCDGSQVANSDLSQAAICDKSFTYEVRFTVSGYSAGTLTPVCGTATGTAVNANGAYTQRIICDADGIFALRGNADFAGSVDDVSVITIGHLDAALTATSWGATGGLVFDGATSLGTVYSHADLSGLTSQAWCFLANAASIGEGSQGTFYGVPSNDSTSHFVCFFTGGEYMTRVDCATTDSFLLTNASDAVLNSNVWVLADHDDSNVLGNGRVSRIHVGQNGGTTALIASVSTAAVGAVNVKSDNYSIGNRSSGTTTFDGTIYAIVLFNGNAIADLDTVYYPTLLKLDPAVS